MATFFLAQVRTMDDAGDLSAKDYVHEDHPIEGLFRTLEEAEAALPGFVDEILSFYKDEETDPAPEWNKRTHESYTNGFWFESEELGVEGRALVREVRFPD